MCKRKIEINGQISEKQYCIRKQKIMNNKNVNWNNEQST